MIHFSSFIKAFPAIIFFLQIYTSQGVGQVFPYDQGRAEADGRRATLEITVDGMIVTGKLRAFPVCETGIRLTETKLTFSGIATGPWEADKTVISGTWDGGDYGCNGQLMPDYPKHGAIMISIRPSNNPDTPGKEVYVLRIAGSSYGYIFKPKGTGSNAPGTSGVLPDWLTTPPGTTDVYFVPGAETESPAGALGPPASTFKMPNTYNTCPLTPIALAWGESKTLSIKNLDRFVLTENGQVIRGKIVSYSYTIDAFCWQPQGVLRVRKVSPGVMGVKGEKEGAGQVFINATLTITDDNGVTWTRSGRFSWLVLVGKKALSEYKGEKDTSGVKPQPPTTVGDVKKIVFNGRLLRRGSNEAIGDADIHLEPDRNQERNTSRPDGRFQVSFHNLVSGRYEFMALKRSRRADLPPDESVKLDLWPIKRYVIDITPKKAAAGPIDVGTIWMDRAGIIWYGGPGRDRIEEIGKPDFLPDGSSPAPFVDVLDNTVEQPASNSSKKNVADYQVVIE